MLLLTEWRQYRELDPVAFGSVVAVRGILDGRNCLDPVVWRAAGWHLPGARPALNPSASNSEAITVRYSPVLWSILSEDSVDQSLNVAIDAIQTRVDRFEPYVDSREPRIYSFKSRVHFGSKSADLARNSLRTLSNPLTISSRRLV